MIRLNRKPVQVRIEAGPNAPQASFGAKCIVVFDDGLEVPIPEVRDIRIHMPVDGAVTASIELFPGALKIPALADLFIDPSKDIREQEMLRKYISENEDE